MISKKWKQHFVLLFTGILIFAGLGGRIPASSAYADSAAETVTVTIDQAEKTEYLKDPESDEEVIRFFGNVSLTVDNRGSKTVIQADAVTFNRKRATVYASGNVSFEQSGNDKNKEKLTADTLLFNTQTLEGVFDNGRIVQESSGNSNLSTGSVLVIFADSFGRENGGTVTFRNGSLTFCDDEDPHWKIDASRIWLLPGKEFAFFNGLLYVGHFPVLYIPFFYYPKEEMIFNPSFGYDPRKGYYTQTTTYIIGRKGLSSSSEEDEEEAGLFNFMKTTELKEQVREGLFLHNLDADAVLPDNSLKVMVDGYSNLGFMGGIEGVFKPKKIFSDISFGSYIGYSHTLFPVRSSFGEYTTFSPTDQQYTDKGWVLGKSVPFRFGANLKTVFTVHPVSFTIDVPVYSDPYFTSDFISERKESMDWINFLLDNVTSTASSEETASSGSSLLNGYLWSFTGSIATPGFLKPLTPWLQDFSLSSISSQVSFSSKDNSAITGETKEYDPNRSFYYPSGVSPIKLNSHIGGKLLSIGSTTSGKSEGTFSDLELPDSLAGYAEQPAKNPAETEVYDGEIDLLEPSPLKVEKLSAVSLPGFVWDITYSISPALATEVNYDATSFTSPDTIDWNTFKNKYLQLRCPVNLQSKASWRGGYIGMTSALDFSPVYQSHSNISQTFYDESSLNQLLLADYTARVLNLDYSTSLSYKPFIYVDWLSATSISLNSGLKVVRTEFIGTVEKPEWKYNKPKWNEESFSAQNVTGVLAATQFSKRVSENLTVKVNLPPLKKRVEITTAVAFPTCTSLSVTAIHKVDDSGKWIHEPVTQSSAWSFFNKKVSFNQSFKYNIEDKHSENASYTLSLYGASLSYNMLYTTPYKYVEKAGWVADKDKEFLPYSLNMRYSMPSTEWKLWNETIHIKPSVTSTVSIDLIRPTQSSLGVTSGLSFVLTDFLTVTVAAESQNKVIYRYIQDSFHNGVEIPGEENIFKDIWNSVSFWNTKARENSGFKLKNFSISVDHSLHDWTLHSEFKMSPRLLTENKVSRYDYAPYFTLSVKWNPMGSLKTTVEDQYGEFVLNPSTK